MALGRGDPHAVLLGNGKVLVVGNDGEGDMVRPDSVQSEIWDPADGTWSAGPSLNALRAAFVAVPVAGGGVLVTGGVNAGVADEEGYQDRHQSYSSTYVYDPWSDSVSWLRKGLLDRARTFPTAAALLDGRVLVAGGYYLSGARGSVPGAVLAAYRPDSDGLLPNASSPPADVSPPALIPALATAELYDPATGSWSATGALRYARVGAPAVTLADGRVLVVGSASAESWWNYTVPGVSDRAFQTAEIYDPRTGRFSLTGDLPAVDWSPLSKLGPYPIRVEGGTGPYIIEVEGATGVGTLVALADGGALLVGQVTSWYIDALELEGSTVRTLRFDPATGRWAQVDQAVYAIVSGEDSDSADVIVAGHSREGALAVRLGDGRVLVAGGTVVELTATAELYDPATGSWFTLPPMPEPHAGGAAVLLADGSVLVVGGHDLTHVGSDDTGISTAIRFVPGP